MAEPSSQKHPSCFLPAGASCLTFNRVDFLCMIIFASQPVGLRKKWLPFKRNFKQVGDLRLQKIKFKSWLFIGSIAELVEIYLIFILNFKCRKRQTTRDRI